MLPFHPYADLFPLIEGEAFAELVADVKANDLREKIVVWDGAILDGRNRYLAAMEAGLIEDDDGPDRIKYFSRFVPAVDGDALAFVISKNLRRRHLDDRQRASVAGKIANLSHGGDRSKPPIGGLTAEQAAEQLNVSPRQVERARVVHEQGIPELRQTLDRGEIAVSEAERIARMSQEEQIEIIRHLPRGARAIMGSRQEPDDSLDYFPTPPWATRALINHALISALGIEAIDIEGSAVWEPACGEGHIAEVLAEYFSVVLASDAYDYGYGQIQDFLDYSGDKAKTNTDWIITNPPFGELTEQFVLKSLDLANIGVAMFVRLQWLETIGRYERLFRDKPPTLIAFFCERVNLCKGRWDPDGGTATAYIWLVWIKGAEPQAPFWIPPGCKRDLTRPDDVKRFTNHPVIKRADYLPPHDPETGELHEDAA